jgi:hypothetical protein
MTPRRPLSLLTPESRPDLVPVSPWAAHTGTSATAGKSSTLASFSSGPAGAGGASGSPAGSGSGAGAAAGTASSGAGGTHTVSRVTLESLLECSGINIETPVVKALLDGGAVPGSDQVPKKRRAQWHTFGRCISRGSDSCYPHAGSAPALSRPGCPFP